MKKEEFKAELLTGHNGAVVEVPFDPAKLWAIPARPLWPGRRGHTVRGELGCDWKRDFHVVTNLFVSEDPTNKFVTTWTVVLFQVPLPITPGELNGVSFGSCIVPRSRRFWMLVDDEVQKKAGVKVGETIRVIVEPLIDSDEST